MTFTELLPYIGTGCLIAVIIILLFIIICKLDNIKFRQNVAESEINDVKELVSNVVQGSKRIERNVDAINQRTRAEKNRKTTNLKEKRGVIYEGKTKKSSSYKKNDHNKYSPTITRK